MRSISFPVLIAVLSMAAVCRGEELSRQQRLEKASGLYREGKVMVDRGDYKAANEQFALAQEMLGESHVTPQREQPLRRPVSPDTNDLRRADLLYNQAVTHIKNDEFKKAQSCLEEAVEFNPQDKDSYYNLGVIYEVYLKDRNAAAASYLRYVLLEDDAEKADIVKRWIAELKKGSVK